MAIFAIGDLHLSLGTDKPMDVFPGWEGYLPKLEANWRRLIAPEDTVLLAGDGTYECLVTIPGIGPRTASELVIGINIEDFPDHDHLASYCGIAPRNRQSGTSISSVSASRQGNRRLKNLLIFSCNSLVRSENRFGEYYRACRGRGMCHGEALKAVARKRLKVIYAIMRDKVPYSA